MLNRCLHNKPFLFILLTLWVAVMLAASCGNGRGGAFRHPPDVRIALREAGANRPELEAVLEYYATLGDTLKWRAACFLIGHMPGKRSVLLHDLGGGTEERIFTLENGRQVWW